VALEVDTSFAAESKVHWTTAEEWAVHVDMELCEGAAL